MRTRRVLIVGVNLTLLVAFWPLTHDFVPVDTSTGVAYKPTSVSMPDFIVLPEQSELVGPLFRAKVPPPKADEPASNAGSSPNLRLLGIVLTDEHQIAVLEHNGATIRVEEGDDLNGWKVTKIESRKIRLESLGQNIDVLLDALEKIP